jgi:hypothetical protein
MKSAKYFSHDADARRDPKIVAMITKYGIGGYGRWWVIVEMLREQDGYCLPCKNWAYEAIGAEISADKDEAQKFIKSLISEYELLKTDGESFWSESLSRRMVKLDEKIRQARIAGLASAEARGQKAKTDSK